MPHFHNQWEPFDFTTFSSPPLIFTPSTTNQTQNTLLIRGEFSLAHHLSLLLLDFFFFYYSHGVTPRLPSLLCGVTMGWTK